MIETLTAEQMRAIERAAIESGEVTGLELMERAGTCVVEEAFDEWSDLALSPGQAVVLCGPGNNGGDGYVVARLLDDMGWEVRVYAYGNPVRLPPDAHENYRRWTERGEVRPLSSASEDLCSASIDIIVDAVFGTGLTRPLDGELVQALASVRSWGGGSKIPPVTVSVDMPTGICSDSGRELGGSCDSDLTVTFHTAKPGHYLGAGPLRCGAVRVVDIGLHGNAGRSTVDVVDLPPLLEKGGLAAEHKFHHGHLLVLSGGAGKGGAARLAARGALRIGAGVVTIGCPPSALQENAAQLNAIMLEPVRTGQVLSDLLDGDSRVNALCLGPGLGTGEREQQLVAAALRAGKATVLDADALTLVAREASLFDALHERCVLTPHSGEFSRLFPDLATRLSEEPKSGPAFSKADAVREASARAGCTVLLKGPDTVIASVGGRVAISAACYERAAPWLATAGSGDVLAGFVAGLLALGFGTRDAAVAAAFVHVECALEFGPGLISEDLPDVLPRVLDTLF